jgi:hypothetical protein
MERVSNAMQNGVRSNQEWTPLGKPDQAGKKKRRTKRPCYDFFFLNLSLSEMRGYVMMMGG